MNQNPYQAQNGYGGPAEPDPIPGPTMGVHGSAPADIIEFLEHATAPRKEGQSPAPLDCISLYQEMFDGTREKVRDIAIKAIDPVALSEMLSRIVMGRASVRGKRTTFILEAWAGAEMRGTHVIERDVQPATRTSVAFEPPTDAGLAAQSMRHVEVMHRQSSQYNDVTFSHLARMNRELVAENRDLRAREVQNMVLLRNNLIEGAEIEYRREANKVKVQAAIMLFQTLLASLPSLIEKFTANEVVERFRTFVSTLAPEEQIGIASALSQEHKEQLAGLFKALEKPKLPAPLEKIVVESRQVPDPASQASPQAPPPEPPPPAVEAAPAAPPVETPELVPEAVQGTTKAPRRKKVVEPKDEE